MEHPFNPYLEWLNIRDTQPSYYRLLGLDPFEQDLRIITNAAEGTAARIRGFTPGAQQAAWNHLLDEIQTAKACLLSPDRKNRYDVELRSQQAEANRAPGNTPVSGAAQPTAARPAAEVPAAQIPMGMPGNVGPVYSPQAPGASAYGSANPPAGQALQGPQAYAPQPGYGAPIAYPVAGYPVAAYGQPMATPAYPGQIPAGYPVQPNQPAGYAPQGYAPHAMPDPMAPMTATSAQTPVWNGPSASPYNAVPSPGMAAPVGLPMGRAVSAVQPGTSAVAVQAVPSFEGSSRSVASSYRRSSRNQSFSVMLSVGAIVVLAIVSWIAYSMKPDAFAKNSKSGTPTRTSSSQSPSIRETIPEKLKPADRTPNRTVEVMLGRAPGKIPTETIPTIYDSNSNDPPPPASETDPRPDDPKPEPTPDTKPVPETPTDPEPAPTPAPAPETAAVEATPAEVAALNTALSKVLTLLGTRDVEAALTQLENASKLAKNDEMIERVNAMRTVYDGVDIFWSAVNEAVIRLSVGDVVEFGSTALAIVEVLPDRLTIRMLGKNRSYAKRGIPAGLALHFAQTSLDLNTPSSQVALGAFLLVEPNGDKAQAKKYWEEAGRKGFDTTKIMPLLEK